MQFDPCWTRFILYDKVRSLKHSRQSIYALADWTVHTDRLTPEQVAAEVVRALDLSEDSSKEDSPSEVVDAPIRHSLNPDSPPPIVVASGPWPYLAVVGWNHLSTLGAQLKRILPQATERAVLTDDDVWQRICGPVEDSLHRAQVEVHVKCVPPDERIKTAEGSLPFTIGCFPCGYAVTMSL